MKTSLQTSQERKGKPAECTEIAQARTTPWTFERIERKCAANDKAKAAGRRLIYDFRVLRNGQFVGWFSKTGGGYCLCDPYWEAVRKPNPGRGSPMAVIAKKQPEFEAVLERYGGKIPTITECMERTAERNRRLIQANASMAKDRESNPDHYR